MAGRTRSSSARPGRGSARGTRNGGGNGGRGGRGAPARRGGAGPTIAAAAVVIGVIALVIVLAGGKKDKGSASNKSSLAPAASQTPGASGPQVPARPPPPDLPAAVRKQAQEIAEKARAVGPEVEKIYGEAMEAKRASNDELWQEKLEEASQRLYEILDLWNELLVDVPTSDDWPDQEEVANVHLGAEGDAITRALTRLHDIQKQRRR